MARTIGYVLGAMMLLNGITDAIQPRFGFRVWQERLRQYFPESLNRMVSEFGRLSDTSLRYIAFWEVALAGLLLWLASRSRD